MSVVVNGQNAEAGERFDETLRRSGAEARFVAADTGSFDSMVALMENVKAEVGPVRVLIASGASSVDSPTVAFFGDTDPNDYLRWANKVWASRLSAVKAVLPQMIDNNGGFIVMLSTDAGRWSTPGESIPGGAVSALHMTARVMAREFNRWKIRVNVVATTVVGDSPGADRVQKYQASKIFAKALARQTYPLSSDDIAEAVTVLASEPARSITGQILGVNGAVSVGL